MSPPRASPRRVACCSNLPSPNSPQPAVGILHLRVKAAGHVARGLPFFGKGSPCSSGRFACRAAKRAAARSSAQRSAQRADRAAHAQDRRRTKSVITPDARKPRVNGAAAPENFALPPNESPKTWISVRVSPALAIHEGLRWGERNEFSNVRLGSRPPPQPICGRSLTVAALPGYKNHQPKVQG